MKKRSIYLVIFGVFCSLAYSQKIEWQRTLGGSGFDEAYAVCQTSDGGYVVSGYSASVDNDVINGHESGEAWIVKLSPIGNIEWQETFGRLGKDVAHSIKQTKDGGFIVAGNNYSDDSSILPDPWVAKLNEKGKIIWSRNLSYNGEVYSIHQNNEGNYVVAGYIYNLRSDGWICKLDNNGSVLWQKRYGGKFRDYIRCVSQTDDNGYIAVGYSNFCCGNKGYKGGAFDVWLLKVNADGNEEWQKNFGGIDEERAYSVKQTKDGGYVLVGFTDSSDVCERERKGSADAWILKLNRKGETEWQKCFGGAGSDIAYSVVQNADNEYIIAGSTSSNNGDVSGNQGKTDFWLVKLNSSGEIVWQKCFGGTNAEEIKAIAKTADGGYIAVGYTSSKDGDINGIYGETDFWIVKIAPEKY